MKEVWKDIKGYSGYQVSNLGRIRTHNKITHTERHGDRKWKDRVLRFRGKNIATGYRVSLWKDGKPKDFLVCRLVATTFLEGLIETQMTVNHKDGNRFNNNVENLEWLTIKGNVNHAFDNGLCTSNKKTILTKIGTVESYKFRSMTKASKFLGYCAGYISGKLKNGENVVVAKDGTEYLIETF